MRSIVHCRGAVSWPSIEGPRPLGCVPWVAPRSELYVTAAPDSRLGQQRSHPAAQHIRCRCRGDTSGRPLSATDSASLALDARSYARLHDAGQTADTPDNSRHIRHAPCAAPLLACARIPCTARDADLPKQALAPR